MLRVGFWRDQQALGRPDLVAVRRRESAVVAGALVIAFVAKRKPAAARANPPRVLARAASQVTPSRSAVAASTAKQWCDVAVVDSCFRPTEVLPRQPATALEPELLARLLQAPRAPRLRFRRKPGQPYVMARFEI